MVRLDPAHIQTVLKLGSLFVVHIVAVVVVVIVVAVGSCSIQEGLFRSFLSKRRRVVWIYVFLVGNVCRHCPVNPSTLFYKGMDERRGFV